jgi:hypothetical protein
MAKFAVILNNTVVNIIDAPDLSIAQEATGLLCVEYDNNLVQIGDEFEETSKKKVK